MHASFEAAGTLREYSLIRRCNLDSKIEQKLSKQLQNQNAIAQWGICKYTWEQYLDLAVELILSVLKTKVSPIPASA